MDQFDSDKNLNALDEMFVESLKKSDSPAIDQEIKIDIDDNKKINTMDNLFIKEYSDFTNQEYKSTKVATSTKRKRGRPKGSIKKVNRKQVASQKLTISLTQEEKDILEKEAARDHRSVSSFIKIKLIQAGVFVRK